MFLSHFSNILFPNHFRTHNQYHAYTALYQILYVIIELTTHTGKKFTDERAKIVNCNSPRGVTIDIIRLCSIRMLFGVL